MELKNRISSGAVGGILFRVLVANIFMIIYIRYIIFLDFIGSKMRLMDPIIHHDSSGRAYTTTINGTSENGLLVLFLFFIFGIMAPLILGSLANQYIEVVRKKISKYDSDTKINYARKDLSITFFCFLFSMICTILSILFASFTSLSVWTVYAFSLTSVVTALFSITYIQKNTISTVLTLFTVIFSIVVFFFLWPHIFVIPEFYNSEWFYTLIIFIVTFVSQQIGRASCRERV